MRGGFAVAACVFQRTADGDVRRDEDGESYIPANELWIFGGTVGKFAMYGGLQVKSWEENTLDYRHYRARKDIGGLVHHPEQARRIVDTSVTP